MPNVVVDERIPASIILESERNVERGASFLDEKIPGWEKAIELEHLHMGSTEECILGQLWMQTNIFPHTHGDYGDAVDELLEGSETRSEQNGFTLTFEWTEDMVEAGIGSPPLWDMLAQLWVIQVRARRPELQEANN